MWTSQTRQRISDGASFVDENNVPEINLVRCPPLPRRRFSHKARLVALHVLMVRFSNLCYFFSQLCDPLFTGRCMRTRRRIGENAGLLLS